MFDGTAMLIDNAAHGRLYAMPAAVCVGIVSSAGPCVVPRCVALAALCSGGARRTVTLNTMGFIGGIVLVYASFGAIASVVARLLPLAAWLYALLALFLAAAGVRTLLNPSSCCATQRACRRPAWGGSALSGMALSLVPSACCTPIVLALLSLTGAGGNALFSCALLACFAIGHCVPLCAFILGARGCRVVLRRHAKAAGVISASITLAMSGYYALLV